MENIIKNWWDELTTSQQAELIKKYYHYYKGKIISDNMIESMYYAEHRDIKYNIWWDSLSAKQQNDLAYKYNFNIPKDANNLILSYYMIKTIYNAEVKTKLYTKKDIINLFNKFIEETDNNHCIHCPYEACVGRFLEQNL